MIARVQARLAIVYRGWLISQEGSHWVPLFCLPVGPLGQHALITKSHEADCRKFNGESC